MAVGQGDRTIKRRDWGIAVLRVVVGFVFFMHGWQKLFDMGIPGVAGFFGQLGIPEPMVAATVVSLLELVGGLALLVGLFTRWIAVPLAIDMLVASVVIHLPAGFFAPAGVELVLLLLAASVALTLAGPGAFALDQVIVRRGAGAAAAGRRADELTL